MMVIISPSLAALKVSFIYTSLDLTKAKSLNKRIMTLSSVGVHVQVCLCVCVFDKTACGQGTHGSKISIESNDFFPDFIITHTHTSSVVVQLSPPPYHQPGSSHQLNQKCSSSIGLLRCLAADHRDSSGCRWSTRILHWQYPVLLIMRESDSCWATRLLRTHAKHTHAYKTYTLFPPMNTYACTHYLLSATLHIYSLLLSFHLHPILSACVFSEIYPHILWLGARSVSCPVVQPHSALMSVLGIEGGKGGYLASCFHCAKFCLVWQLMVRRER